MARLDQCWNGSFTVSIEQQNKRQVEACHGQSRRNHCCWRNVCRHAVIHALKESGSHLMNGILFLLCIITVVIITVIQGIIVVIVAWNGISPALAASTWRALGLRLHPLHHHFEQAAVDMHQSDESLPLESIHGAVMLMVNNAFCCDDAK